MGFGKLLASIDPNGFGIKFKATETRVGKNRKIILEALKRYGISKVVVSYDGSGDCGSIGEVKAYNKAQARRPSWEGESMEIGHLRVKIFKSKSKFNEGADRWEESEEVEDTTLEEAIEDFTYDALALHHGGWENNDGAFGTTTFFVGKKKITMDHNARYTQIDQTETDL